MPEIVEKLNLYLEGQKETAYVTSAVSFTSEESQKLNLFLKKQFGRDLKVKLMIDKTVLGGLKIVVGDSMIDQTIVGKLFSLVEKIED